MHAATLASQDGRSSDRADADGILIADRATQRRQDGRKVEQLHRSDSGARRLVGEQLKRRGLHADEPWVCTVREERAEAANGGARLGKLRRIIADEVSCNRLETARLRPTCMWRWMHAALLQADGSVPRAITARASRQRQHVSLARRVRTRPHDGRSGRRAVRVRLEELEALETSSGRVSRSIDGSERVVCDARRRRQQGSGAGSKR
ncbi:hypothetical protein DPSP01_014743 [Paraphaeosphaeria sporulosa]